MARCVVESGLVSALFGSKVVGLSCPVTLSYGKLSTACLFHLHRLSIDNHPTISRAISTVLSDSSSVTSQCLTFSKPFPKCLVGGSTALAAEEDEDEGYDSEDELGRRGGAREGFRLLKNGEKKELRAYAHQLGKGLNVQQVGKAGVTATVVKSISDALEANELVKVKVLDNCSDEIEVIESQLEDKTSSQVVGQIGRTLLLYRASLRKLEALQKRKEFAQRKRGPPFIDTEKRTRRTRSSKTSK